MFSRIYLVIGILILALYAIVALGGVEFGDAQRQMIPADVRQSPGGYRSFHFWHSGYRGGK
ncbi:MAG TPA: hypothetical protein VNO14_05360 [Blastocatellia bacterium]|nr:hypothetical protein [Blastocatellia bacterium]